MSATDTLRETVLWLLDGGNAHASLAVLLEDCPVALRGKKPRGQPHTAWRLLEHLRIAQRDILDFTLDPEHDSPPWPEGYWPETDAPPDEAAWDASVQAFLSDLAKMRALVADPTHDLLAEIPGAEGPTILREALLLADHNAYHQGQLALLRRLLGLPAVGA